MIGYEQAGRSGKSWNQPQSSNLVGGSLSVLSLAVARGRADCRRRHIFLEG
jgi:hypothetical protein